MKQFMLVPYLFIAIFIYHVITKVAERTGRQSAKVKAATVALALTWPMWGEVGLVAILIYVLYTTLQKSAASHPGSTQQ